MAGVKGRDDDRQIGRDAAGLVGQIVARRYRLEAVIGTGAAGVVYRATHRKRSGRVAIKFLAEAAGDSARARGRFEREAKALMRLKHPGIVELRDYGVYRGQPFLVMELLEGMTLRDRIKRKGPLPYRQGTRVMRQVLAALAAAHARGMIHRDLKPANIFLTRDAVKLLDFGLVKFIAGEAPGVDQTLTQTGMVVGTPLYMAPEQGTGDHIDRRVDVYAAGCVLYELLTGVAPFRRASSAETIRAHLVQPVPQLSPLSASTSARFGLNAVLSRSLAKDPARRYPDAAAMLEGVCTLERIGRRRLATALWRRFRAWLWVPAAAALLLTGWAVITGTASRPAGQRATVAVDGVRGAGVHARLFDGRDRGVPPELSAIDAAVTAGQPLSKRQRLDLRAYRRLYPDDPRPYLLLGHHYARLNWHRDALARYARAFALGPHTRPVATADPRLLRNLVDIAGSHTHGGAAADMLVEAYGPAALPQVRRALSGLSPRHPRAARLSALVGRLSGGTSGAPGGTGE